MSVTSNTGPIIALAKADRLSVLQALYGTVHISAAVHRELLARIGSEATRIDDALRSFLIVEAPLSLFPEVEHLTRSLGAGEQQALGLALARAELLLLDDRAARQAARQLGVRITGVAGVLIEAKRHGFIPEVRPLLEAIRNQGYWLSEALIDTAARLTGE